MLARCKRGILNLGMIAAMGNEFACIAARRFPSSRQMIFASLSAWMRD